jgi:type IV secretory pathway TrbL component
MVSSMVMVFLLVEVAGTTHELVGGRAWRYGRGRWDRAVEAALENALDVPAVRHAAAGGGKGPMTSGVRALGAVLLGAAQDAEYGAVAHLRMGVTLEGAAHDLFDVRPEL